VLTEHDMPIAPSTYYALRACPVSPADWDDAHMANGLFDIWTANRRLYGSEKLWTAALDDGLQIGRDQVARLMAILGIEGVRRGRHRTKTTIRDPKASRHPDLIKTQRVRLRWSDLRGRRDHTSFVVRFVYALSLLVKVPAEVRIEVTVAAQRP
jgi:hypothetical protein